MRDDRCVLPKPFEVRGSGEPGADGWPRSGFRRGCGVCGLCVFARRSAVGSSRRRSRYGGRTGRGRPQYAAAADNRARAMRNTSCRTRMEAMVIPARHTPIPIQAPIPSSCRRSHRKCRRAGPMRRRAAHMLWRRPQAQLVCLRGMVGHPIGEQAEPAFLYDDRERHRRRTLVTVVIAVEETPFPTIAQRVIGRIEIRNNSP